MNKEPFDQLFVDGVEVRLQRYPHIAHKIVLLWGTVECLNYLNQLIYNQDRGFRPEPCVGFDKATLDELLRLIDSHPKINEVSKKPTYPHYRWVGTDHVPL